MGYLEKLKNLPNVQDDEPKEPNKPQSVGFLGFLGSPYPILKKIHAAEARQFWLLHFADRNPLEVAFTPAARHVEVLASYPSALAAEPIDPGRRQPGTPLAGDQEAEIRSWLVAIGETDQATIAEALTGCRQDEDVRRYFLGRAGEIPADDQRRCNQCGNLREGVCVIAAPGGVVSAMRGYRPAQGVPQRCAGYKP